MNGESREAASRAISGGFLLAALREQDAARDAIAAAGRAQFLSSASRDLAMSLDQETTRAIIQRRALPRDGAWCIVDVLESTGVMRRLPVVHPDPRKQALARAFACQWQPALLPASGRHLRRGGEWDPRVVVAGSAEEILTEAYGPGNLALMNGIGFGALLVVPLIVRASVIGTMTFVTREGDAPLTADEIAMAVDLAHRCAMALDNARLYRTADVLRASADVANKAKSSFLGSMSHELRTPLNAIGGYAELMEMGLRGAVTDEQRVDLGRIKHNQRHLLALITEILNFVRTESGRMEYHFTEVAMQPALDEVAEMLQGAVTERGLVLHRGHAQLDAVVWADGDRMRQILMNLLMNAVKYTPTGGGAIHLTSTVTRDSVIVQVADHGHGIPPDKLEMVFEPFTQLQSGLTNRQGGLGLGLTISRDLARAMQGTLTVDSTMGVGSRFTLTLPRARQDFTAR